MDANGRKPEVLLKDEAMRDGSQMEARVFSLAEKQQFFELFRQDRVPRIHSGYFVHPKIVPQMADTEALIAVIGPSESLVVSRLILHTKGLERAFAAA